MSDKPMYGFDYDGVTVAAAREHLLQDGFAPDTFHLIGREFYVRVLHWNPDRVRAAHAALSQRGHCALLALPPESVAPAAQPYRGFDGVDTVDLLVMEGEIGRAPSTTVRATGVLNRIQEELAHRPVVELVRAVRQLNRKVRMPDFVVRETDRSARHEATQKVTYDEARRIAEEARIEPARTGRAPDAKPWQAALFIPEGREQEVWRLLEERGVEVYRVWEIKSPLRDAKDGDDR
ncbi:hypothetical protein AB0K21_21915 [Streptosporangium sp. NPDC049248]|uniref:hypothetical protein n=1 Tax=Streptosporangium sp. NPDC049248 TaxID=3155651 RepID=UPI0034460F56